MNLEEKAKAELGVVEGGIKGWVMAHPRMWVMFAYLMGMGMDFALHNLYHVLGW